MIAMALSCKPSVVLCDEPTTALDVTVQDQVLRLLAQLCEEMGSSLVFVTHDLAVVSQTCSRMSVMYAGRLMEQGSVRGVYEAPRHPYTEALFASAPDFDEPERELVAIPGPAAVADRPAPRVPVRATVRPRRRPPATTGPRRCSPSGPGGSPPATGPTRSTERRHDRHRPRSDLTTEVLGRRGSLQALREPSHRPAGAGRRGPHAAPRGDPRPRRGVGLRQVDAGQDPRGRRHPDGRAGPRRRARDGVAPGL